jgi:hypothetical protein
MFNKIELKNNWESFKVKFAGKEYTVPTGLFEVEETLWNFIKSQATKWWIKLIVASRPEAPSVKKIEDSKIKEIKEDSVVKEDAKKKK